MPYIEKRIISGDLLEIERYFTTSTGRKMPKSLNENETSKGQEDLNNKYAQKRLIRLLNANFSGKDGDLFVTLTYAKQVEEEQAKKEVVNFLRRLSRFRGKQDLPKIKYIVITEHQEHWHHHIIMSGMPNALEEVKRIWGRGRVQISVLDKAYNFEDLGRYLIKSEKPSKKNPEIENTKEQRKKHARRWNSSLNLKQPIVETKEISRTAVNKQPKPPKGYYMLPNWSSGCDAQGNLYMFFSCVKLEDKPPKKKSKQNRRKS